MQHWAEMGKALLETLLIKILLIGLADDLLNTRSYMSHLKAKIKRPVFQKNVKVDRELLELLLEFACKSFSYFSMSNHFQENIKKILILEILKNETTCCSI